ncbi:nucleotidyltransferase [bacterium]|nr:nucleotidyltransferase [bacterium]
MKIVGVIAEFNPFHNGHLYLFNNMKKMFPDAVYILIMSGNFTQRGEPSILDKRSKTEIALKTGFDLVVELPFPFATASSEIFAEGAIELAHALGVTDLLFGSESDDLTYLNEMIDIELYNNSFDPLVRVYLASGLNYPTARSQAFNDITGKSIKLPNDILASSYLKAIKKNNYNIKAHSIKRTNDYNSNYLEENISSASSIRKALLDGKNITKQVPSFVVPYLEDIKDSVITTNSYFKYLKYKLITDNNDNTYPSLDKGLLNKLKKNIAKVSSYDELINSVKTKNITYRKIARGLLYYLCDFTIDSKEKMSNITYIRILGLSNKGRCYLNRIKKDCSLPIISKFTRKKDDMLALEYKTTIIYSLEYNNKYNVINDEFKVFPIRKDE